MTLRHGLPVNYDVENFRAKQRDSEQIGQMGSVFGSLFGNIIANSQQEYAAKGQENRFEFYGKLANFLGESYWEAIASEMAFKGAYLSFQDLGGTGVRCGSPCKQNAFGGSVRRFL